MELTPALNTWRLLPAMSYSTQSGNEEHSVSIRQVAGGEFMVLIVKGTIEDHQHGTKKFQKSALEAMKVAEKLIGPRGKWTLSSFLEYVTKDKRKDLALLATVHAMGGDVLLSTVATPLTPVLTTATARGKVDAVLANHAHDIVRFKGVRAAMRAAPEAMRRAAKKAKCECTEISEPKKKTKR